jgi:hypothetical protein
MQSQITAFQQANKAIHKRKRKEKKSINVSNAISVREGQAIIDQDLVEAQIREEMKAKEETKDM